MANPIVLFSWQIYSQLLKLGLLTGAAGSFVSPLSLYLALALVLNGAGASDYRTKAMQNKVSVMCALRSLQAAPAR